MDRMLCIVGPTATGKTRLSVALAQAALQELGYSSGEIGAALKGIKTDGMPTEEIVRQCLRAMVMR